MINPAEFEVYQVYLQLQKDHRDTYKRMKQQYELCKFEAEMELILFAIELADLNAKVAKIEERISPEIGSVLSEMQVPHTITTDGITTLLLIKMHSPYLHMQAIPNNVQEYYDKRISSLGIPDEMLEIALYTDSFKNTGYHQVKNRTQRYRVFEANEKGIGILLYSIEREVHWFRTVEGKQKTREYRQTRLLYPKVRGDGSVQKYEIPKGQPTLPFFPPVLLDKYEAGEAIDTLYLTEGHFKAFKAAMHGIMCVGLPSITCLKDASGGMHSDVLKLIKKCAVQKVVWLQDGDCRDITSKEITDKVDLAQRPNVFYKSAESFSDLLAKEPVRLYFAHINTQELEGHPKGLDDLLCLVNAKEREKVTDEFNDFRIQKAGFYSGVYLTRIEITRSTHQVFKYFLLDDVNEFYHFHSEYRPELKDTGFKFFGTTYRYDPQTSRCNIVIPKGATNYFRVGDTYYQYVEIPDQWGRIIRTFERREKKTIQDDNDKDIFKHIPKYTSFCNVPSHTDYQQVIHNCYNLYHPFSWEPEEGDCCYTLRFLKHIFGTDKVQLDVHDTDSFVERWELGLDYLQLLFQHPQQILPILCLVSVERQTGKTTFADWLKEIFQENMVIVGNTDIKGDFNAHWISRLLVCIDETKIDNEHVVERMKALSTAKSAILNSKGKDQKSIAIFSKQLLISNREDDFIKIDKEEIRFWVVKVSSLTDADRDVKLLKKMVAEIPHFLYFLDHRSIKAPEKERHWFESRLLITEALKRVVARSKMTLEKQLTIALTELFEASALAEVTLPLNELASIVKQQNNKSYVSETLKRMGYKTSEYPNTKYFPRMVERREPNGEISLACEYIKFKGRYYTFSQEHFISA